MHLTHLQSNSGVSTFSRIDCRLVITSWKIKKSYKPWIFNKTGRKQACWVHIKKWHIFSSGNDPKSVLGSWLCGESALPSAPHPFHAEHVLSQIRSFLEKWLYLKLIMILKKRKVLQFQLKNKLKTFHSTINRLKIKTVSSYLKSLNIIPK